MKPILEELGRICRGHMLEPKVLLVPSVSYGKQLEGEGALQGIPILNLHVKTVRQLAREVLEELPGGCKREAISDAQVLFLLEKVCAFELKVGSYFHALRDQEGFWRKLWDSLQELELAGGSFETLPGDKVFEDPRKGEELSAIAKALGREMDALGFIGIPGLLKEAAAVLSLDGSHKLSGALFLVPESLELSALGRRFLEALKPGETILLPGSSGGKPWPDVVFSQALGEEAELRGVLRDVLDRNVPFERVQVLWTDDGAYLPFARDLCRRLGVPVTFGAGLPVVAAPAGKAALALLDWMEQGYPAFGLVRMLSSGFLDLSVFCPGEADFPTPTACVSLLRDAVPGWGADRYAPSLERLKAGLTGSEWKEKRGRKAGLLGKALSIWLAKAPVSEGGTLPFGKLLSFLEWTLHQTVPVRGQEDGAARQVLCEMLDSLAFAAGNDISFKVGLNRIRRSVADLRFGREAPSPGKVHFDGFPGKGACLRDSTYVVGLDGMRFPGSGLADPILLDGERSLLAGQLGLTHLRLRAEEPARQRERAMQMLSSLEGRLVCSFPCRSFASGQEGETGPSPFLIDVARNALGRPDLGYEDFRRLVGEPLGYIPEGLPLDARETFLRDLEEGADDDDELRAHFFKVFPWLEEGEKAEEARRSDLFTAYDGNLAPDPDGRDPRITQNPLSCSRLEKLARCPLAFFFEEILKVEPIEEGVPEPWVWLDPMQRGSLLHAVFERFMRTLRDRGKLPDFLKHEPLVLELAELELDRQKEIIPPPSEAVFRAEKGEILDSCRLFLKQEEERCRQVEPRFMEVSFGTGEDSSTGELGFKDPVEVDLGDGDHFLLRGRIDRMDRCPDGSWEVWDYKTGRPFYLSGDDPVEGGRKIQHALYARAAKSMLKAGGLGGEVTRSGYLFTGTKGQGHESALVPDDAKLDEALKNLFDAMAGGSFPGTFDKEVCRRCSWNGLCRSDPARMKELLKDSGVKELATWRRLNPDV